MRRSLEIEEISPGTLNSVTQTLKWKSQKSDLQLSSDDIETLKSFVWFFSEFEEKSNYFGGENYDTVGGVVILIKDLVAHSLKQYDSVKLSDVARQLNNYISIYFGHIIDPKNANFEPFYMVGGFLSPAYHPLLQPHEQKIAMDYLTKEITRTEMKTVVFGKCNY